MKCTSNTTFVSNTGLQRGIPFCSLHVRSKPTADMHKMKPHTPKTKTWTYQFAMCMVDEAALVLSSAKPISTQKLQWWNRCIIKHTNDDADWLHIKTLSEYFLQKRNIGGGGYVASDKGPGKEWAAYSRAHMSRGSPLSCCSLNMTKYPKNVIFTIMSHVKHKSNLL